MRQQDEVVRQRLRLLAGGPFARWLDAAVIRAGADEVELHLPYHDELGGANDGAVLHRGVVAAFAELSGALITVGATPDVTQRRLVLDYLDDAPAGSALYARARVVAGTVYVDIRASDSRTLVARATLTGAGAPPSRRADEPYPQPIYPN